MSAFVSVYDKYYIDTKYFGRSISQSFQISICNINYSSQSLICQFLITVFGKVIMAYTITRLCGLCSSVAVPYLRCCRLWKVIDCFLHQFLNMKCCPNNLLCGSQDQYTTGMFVLCCLVRIDQESTAVLERQVHKELPPNEDKITPLKTVSIL